MESEVKEYLNVYLENKLEAVKMPNPKGKGPSLVLPKWWSSKKVYEDFCEDFYKKN